MTGRCNALNFKPLRDHDSYSLVGAGRTAGLALTELPTLAHTRQYSDCVDRLHACAWEIAFTHALGRSPSRMRLGVLCTFKLHVKRKEGWLTGGRRENDTNTADC